MSKKRKGRKQKRPREKATPQQMLAQGRRHLDNGDARAALGALQQAQHRGAPQAEVAPLLFCACAQRARELSAKGMTPEAAAMAAQADRAKAGVDVSGLDDAALARYVGCLAFPEAMQVYADAVAARGEPAGVARRLADRLVAERRFDALAPLPPDHALRKDAASVQGAVPKMDAGAWEEAGDLLAPVSRRSPFAPWRVFCRGMACFVSGDDEGLRRAAGLLPDDFCLAGVAAEWRRALGEPKAGPGASEAVRAAMWEGDPSGARLAQELSAAVGRGRARDVETLLPRLAEAVYPEDPERAGLSLFQMLGLSVPGDKLKLPALQRAAVRLFGPERAEIAMAKVGMVMMDGAEDLWHPAPVLEYLQHLATEFEDEPRQRIAKGLVLAHLARPKRRLSPIMFALGGPGLLEQVEELTGTRIDDPFAIQVDLMLASLRADPDNREGYGLLLDLVRGGRGARAQAAEALEEMARRFPDDASPCLELADLYYAKNAYRKAEKALEEAARRAPHDDEVLDRQAIAYLVSANRNRNRGKWDLAGRDYRKAEQMGRRRVSQVLTVKLLAMDLLAFGKEALPQVAQAVAGSAPCERLRLVVLLVRDLEALEGTEALTASVWEMVSPCETLIDSLPSAEALAVMSPVEDRFRPLFHRAHVCGVLEGCEDRVLARLQGEDLYAGLEILLAAGRPSAARTEIDRRLKGMPRRGRDPVLLFYLAVIRYEEGADAGPERFLDLVERGDPAQLRRMRMAAARLADHTAWPLQEALRSFDFEVLDAADLLDGLPEIASLFGWDPEEDRSPAPRGRSKQRPGGGQAQLPLPF